MDIETMEGKKMEAQAIERLQAKTPEEAIIERIGADFNLAPFMARTQFEQMRRYFEEYLGLERDIGQVTFLAVSAAAPPGQPIGASQRIAITLTVDSADDLEALHDGIRELRRGKIQRLTWEAQEQGALLTQEDLARLLCTSRSTIKRDIAHLRAAGIAVPTRGQIKDIGKGKSHKSCIVSDWLNGYTYSQIKERQRHSIHAIERYCTDFQRVVRLDARGLTVGEIRVSTGLSERLITEYLELYASVKGTPQQVAQLLQAVSPTTEEPAEIKRGAWLR
jgi:hypothetical protein